MNKNEIKKLSFSKLQNMAIDISDENNGLKKQIIILSEKLDSVNEKLMDAEKLKSHFISNITNEIVNPFASILGLSKNILSLKDDNLQKAGKFANLIYSEAFNLNFQLRNIFTAAKIESGEIQSEILNVDINQLTNSVIDEFEFLCDKKNLNIEFAPLKNGAKDETMYFSTDHEKLNVIISNLLSNAVKHSNNNSTIKLTLNIIDNELIIMIADFGGGMGKDELNHLFNRFKKLNPNINSLNYGHGLGLSITKALIDILDGRIEVVSKKNKGSEFIVSIPAGKTVSMGFASNGNEIIFSDEDEEEF
ncbi:MAG: HAMP domain-containing histidine kinase [Bacteroidales bacterium]|nr:HAMP domain-containing histidine kinase [Bacteroidales bacterium]